MSNEYVDTQINFLENNFIINIDEIKKGEIILKPKIDLEIKYFGFELMLETRGRTSVQKKYFQKNNLAKNQSLLKGETYRFDFQIQGISPSSYQGKNISFNWTILTFFYLKTETSKTVRNSLLKKINLIGALNPNDKLSFSKNLIFNFPQNKYHKNCQAERYHPKHAIVPSEPLSRLQYFHFDP